MAAHTESGTGCGANHLEELALSQPQLLKARSDFKFFRENRHE